jgi:hypothetical protein
MAEDVGDGIGGVVDVDKIEFGLGHGWLAEVLEQMVIEIAIGHLGVKQHSVTVEDDEFEHEISLG